MATLKSGGCLRVAHRDVRFALAFALFAFIVPVAFAVPEYEKHAGALVVYLGVLPAELLQGPPQNAELDATHTRPSVARGTHHVIVAVYDEKTGAAVVDAQVDVRIAPLGMAELREKLDRMKIGGTTTWGGFFFMPQPGPYTMHFTVRRPGAAPVSVQFQYSHPR